MDEYENVERVTLKFLRLSHALTRNLMSCEAREAQVRLQKLEARFRIVYAQHDRAATLTVAREVSTFGRELLGQVKAQQELMLQDAG